MFTGRYPHRTGSIDTFDHLGGERLSLRERTIADILKANGYATGLMGKWHNGTFGEAYHPNRRGFDEFFGFRGGWQFYYDSRVERNGTRVDGEPVPALHGFPLRLVAPGYPGSASQKYLDRIRVRDQQHDGAKMTGYSYRLPAYPVAPGTEVPESDMVVMLEMPVKSLVTFPATGAEVAAGRPTEVRGHAWAGDEHVTEMHVTTDFGATWQKAELESPPNPYSWQRWRAQLTFPTRGYYEIWARATDNKGRMQPFTVNWNPKGYLNNAMHRIAVRVEV